MITLTDRTSAQLPDVLTMPDRPQGSGLWLGVAQDEAGLADAWAANSGPLLVLGSGGTGGTVLCRAIAAQEPALVYSEHAARFGDQTEYPEPLSAQEFMRHAPHAPVAILDGLDEPSLPEDEAADLLAAALRAEVAVIRAHRLPRVAAGLEHAPTVRLTRRGRGWLQSGVSQTAPAIEMQCPWVPPHAGASESEGVQK